MKLIPNWKSAYKYVSVQLTLLMAALSSLEAFLPQMVEFLPPHWAVFLSSAILVARVIQQAKVAVKEVKDEQDLPKNP